MNIFFGRGFKRGVGYFCMSTLCGFSLETFRFVERVRSVSPGIPSFPENVLMSISIGAYVGGVALVRRTFLRSAIGERFRLAELMACFGMEKWSVFVIIGASNF